MVHLTTYANTTPIANLETNFIRRSNALLINTFIIFPLNSVIGASRKAKAAIGVFCSRTGLL